MNNEQFMGRPELDKATSLADVLSKRCRGFLKPEVVEFVVSKLELRKQMHITVLTRDTMMAQAYMCNTIYIDKGVRTSAQMQSGRCLLGNVKFGKRVEVIEDGDKKVVEDIQPQIIQTPLIIQVDNQGIDCVKDDYSNVFILI